MKMHAELVKNVSYYEFLGEDSIRFLNNYCTADLKNWNKTDPIESMILDVKGRLIALTTVFPIPNGLGLLCWGKPEVDLVAHFDRYIFKNDKSIQLVPQAALYFVPAENWQAQIEALVEANSLVNAVEETAAGVWRLDSSQFGSYWLWTKGAATAEELKFMGVETIKDDASVFHLQRIQCNYPLIMQDTVEATLAQELGRDAAAISFTKGCYLGQETVARLDARGHVNWRLARVVLENSLPEGSVLDSRPVTSLQLIDGDSVVGTLTSVMDRGGLVRIRSALASDKSKVFQIRPESGEVLGNCRLA